MVVCRHPRCGEKMLWAALAQVVSAWPRQAGTNCLWKIVEPAVSSFPCKGVRHWRNWTHALNHSITFDEMAGPCNPEPAH